MVEGFEAPGGDLRIRETHEYVGTWRHLDRWSEVGTYTILSSRPATGEADADPWNPATLAMRAMVEGVDGVDEARVAEAIRDTFSTTGCDHEHDCCGCVSTSVDEVRHERGDVWTFKVGRSRNV